MGSRALQQSPLRQKVPVLRNLGCISCLQEPHAVLETSSGALIPCIPAAISIWKFKTQLGSVRDWGQAWDTGLRRAAPWGCRPSRLPLIRSPSPHTSPLLSPLPLPNGTPLPILCRTHNGPCPPPSSCTSPLSPLLSLELPILADLLGLTSGVMGSSHVQIPAF